MNFDEFFKAYLVCALWSSVDDDGMQLSEDYDIDDFADGFLASSREECQDFFDANQAMLEEAHRVHGMRSSTAGNDFWLTRNGHGAGFWDRGMGDIGERLTDAAKVYGGVDLTVGDDGKLYG